MSDLFTDDARKEPSQKPVAISTKRRAVLEFLKTNRVITLTEAVSLIGGNVYANKRFHVGNVLSAMVKLGLIVRLSPAIFALTKSTELESEVEK